MLFGASYYHEYQPYERLEKDLDLMVGAGFTVIRVGESTWASYEPRDGEISFDALASVVDRAHERGRAVIVGTPTYAIPPWLARAHPEVMAQPAIGRPIPFGARQNVDFTAPAFRFHAQRIVRAMGERFGSHPGVVGFQVDNEIGVHQLVNPHVVERFREYVGARLEGAEGVNEKWGLTYWSHRIDSLAELWAPDGNTNPGYALEWERFQARLAVEFLCWQRDLLREIIDDDKFVMHDMVAGHGVRCTDPRTIAQALDHTAVNIYFPHQKGLLQPEPPADELTGLSPDWAEDVGPWAALWRADMAYGARGSRGERFFVTEAQAGSIGLSATNIPPYPGQLRLIGHAFAARGADLLAYWHWHSLHYGSETYWGGVLGHDLAPNRIYAEVAQLGADLKTLTPALEGSVPDADIAMLYSRDSHKALQFGPALLKPGSATPDPATYHRITTRLYQAALDARQQVRIVHADSDWSGQQVLVVPALYIATDELLERIREHARAGAHVICTFRTGYADEWSRARWQRQPGGLREVAGISYQEFSAITRPVPLRGRALPLSSDATAEGWADGLLLEGAEVLAEYDDPFLGRFPAITAQAFGAGRMTWVGTLPDRDSSARLLRWALAERGLAPHSRRWQVPEQVRVNSSTRPDGGKLWFVANHGWAPVTLDVPTGLTEITGTATGSVRLGSWDSRVFRGTAE